MSKYRKALPQLGERLFLTDAGLETWLLFQQGVELPGFAAFTLLDLPGGEAHLRRWFEPFLELARRRDKGFILESPTWRASIDWARPLGYDAARLRAANRRAIELLTELRERWETPASPVVVSGNIGPRGDGYWVQDCMSPEQARDYHGEQIAVFADSGADMVCAMTLNYVGEALGIALAAADAGLPVALSFTVETDGKLPSGDSLEAAIARVDEATNGYPAYYMLNCAHPEHFLPTLEQGGDWTRRLRGLRANASRLSHAELDGCDTLDIGDPLELAEQHRQLLARLPWLTVLGGCCGTDHRHVEAICRACAPGREEAAAVT